MINKVLLVGRLGKDPELKYTASSTAVCEFSLATTTRLKDKTERTEWHNIVIFGKQAETANEYLSKGRLVYIEGSLQTNSWEDKEGNKKYKTTVNAFSFKFLESKDSEGSSYKNQEMKLPVDGKFTSDDIPF